MTLYRQVANEVRAAISAGIYVVGDKLPSVRAISSKKSVSVSTALKAYGVLEQDGWIIASEKSGYFVKRAAKRDINSYVGSPWSGEFEDLMPSLLKHAEHEDILNLGLAQPEASLIPHDMIAREMRAVLRAKGPEIFSYCSAAGLPELRQQIVRLSADIDLVADSEDIVITNGCQEALSVAFQILTSPGDIVAVQSPCYCGALQLLNNLGRKILEIPSVPGGGIRQDLLLDAAKKFRIVACYVMTSVSNPAGGSMSQEDKISLCKLAESEGFPLIEDFSTGELAEAEHNRRPLKSYDTADNVVLCSSFSKTLSPGLRTGWLLTGRHRADALKMKYGFSLNVSALHQLTIANLIAAGHYRRHLSRSRPIRAQTVRLMLEHVRAVFPLQTEPLLPTGGCCLWVPLSGHCDSRSLGMKSVREGVAFAPGPIFSTSSNFDSYMRIGWGGKWESRIANGINTIGSILKTVA